MSEVRVVHVVGARPNYMKIAPVYSALEGRRASCSASFTPASTTTPCSRTSFFAELPLPHPHVELKIGSGTHAEQTARALIGLERAFVELEPTLVVLPGDAPPDAFGRSEREPRGRGHRRRPRRIHREHDDRHDAAKR
jgi:UDP-N-acetylglucosamine 2-epimerase (non-hydrolysing)